MIGEICIRHQIKGENAFLISETFSGKLLFNYVDELFINGRVEACLCGWIEVIGNKCNALLALVEKNDQGKRGGVSGFKPLFFTVENLNLIMTRN